MSEEETVHIDVKAIPDGIWDLGCSVLASSIRRALRDPEKRRDYERWKAERAAKAAQEKE
jgi:hypothetical protein